MKTRPESLRRIAFAIASLVATSAFAQTPAGPLDLPPLAMVEQALAEYPPVRAAREAIRIDEAGARRLNIGPYEYAVRGGFQSHNIPGGRYPEWEIGLERPLRLPGKATADRAIGTQNIELARRTAYSAWCGGARYLLELWFGWARENMQLALWEQQVAALREQQSVVTRRAKVGDAPRVEVNLAEAAVAQAEAVTENFRGREEGARAALARTFPAVKIPLRALPGDRAHWSTTSTGSSTACACTTTRSGWRVRWPRAAGCCRRVPPRSALPDPAIGVRLATDRSSQDKVAGLYVIVPLPGEGRKALADGARAGADVAASHEAAVVQRVTAEVAMMVGRARGAYAAWNRARAAADGMKRNADSMQRSWQLREASLGDVLVARRLAVEASLAAALAQLEAEETRYRLLIEAHILWNDPQEEQEEHVD